jgi:Ala-tRNA(Pro) deacylase
MPISKTLVTFLEKQKIKYEAVEHKRVFTALDKSATLHTDPKEVVKTAVFQAGKNHAFVLVPANRHIDKKKVKTAINVLLRKASQKPEKIVDFATELWMKKNLPGDVGAAPPLGAFFGYPVLVDNALFKQKKLYLNAGSYEHSFLVNQANFKKLLGEDFTKGSFAKK